MSPASFEMAGRRGIGILGFITASVDAFAPLVANYRKGQAEADPSQFFGAVPNFKIAATANAYCDTDDRRGKAIGGAAARWYFGENDAALSQVRLKEYFDKEKFATASKYTDEALIENGIMVAGDPDSCSQTIERWQKLGIDELILLPQAGRTTHEQAKRSIELFGEKVLPRFCE